jgi:alkanesulfonate monooxygenase SsuD/methylene tetrahydromethanopterin reductase-like flavin-dependent oxidoreductase (luciferase family)
MRSERAQQAEEKVYAMRVGVIVLPEHPWQQARAVWQRMEQLGFAHAWTYDHLSWRMFHDKPWYGAVPQLTAAATVTSRMKLGTLVGSPNFRHPVSFAREVVTLDDVSGGRFILGFGAGGLGYDATVLGGPAWSTAERSARYREFVTVLDRLLTGRTLTYRGEYYQAEDARAYGASQQPRVPFYLAATGPKGMRLVATYGQGWVTHDPPGQLTDQVARFEEACHAAGRDPAEPARLIIGDGRDQRPLASLEAFRDAAGRYAELGFTDLVIHHPRPEPPYQADSAVLDQVAAELRDGAL